MEIKSNQLLLNDVIYYTGNQYDSKHEVTKITIYNLYIDKDYIKINDYYYLHSRENGYYYSSNLYFSEKKATNVINNYIEMQEKRKAKYEKEKIIKEQYDKQIIDNKLREKYIDKLIMIKRHNEWEKTKVKEIYATNKGIYLRPYSDGHICKLSREGHTWKMWSELEELETQKQELERRIKEIKDKTEDLEGQV